MTAADLVFLDGDGTTVERIAGHLVRTPGLAWRPGAQCQFDLAGLAPLFDGLEAMRRAGERVRIETEGAWSDCVIEGVDPKRRLLRLSAGDGGGRPLPAGPERSVDDA